MGKRMKKITAVLLAGVTASLACACGQEGVLEDNLVKNKEDRVKTVMLLRLWRNPTQIMKMFPGRHLTLQLGWQRRN